MAINPTWNDPKLRVASDSARTARYRALQSWYRETVLRASPGNSPVVRRKGTKAPQPKLVGSMLTPQFVKTHPGANFLDTSIAAYVDKRVPEVMAADGSIEEGRLRRNLLSSMPLCFNLFGYLRGHKDSPAVVAALAEAFDLPIRKIASIECEVAPQPKEQYLDDRTAFDAAIEYFANDGARCCLGIETKYTEPFSQKQYASDVYRRLTAAGSFKEGAATVLAESGTNQLWRNTLLMLSILEKRNLARGHVAVVALAGDPGAEAAVGGLRRQLVSPDDLIRSVSLEELVARLKLVQSTASWASRFEQRYLGPDPRSSQTG